MSLDKCWKESKKLDGYKLLPVYYKHTARTNWNIFTTSILIYSRHLFLLRRTEQINDPKSGIDDFNRKTQV